MVPYDYIEFSKTLEDLVQKNVVPMSRIDDAVGRILRVKLVAGLFENPFADPTLANVLGSKVRMELFSPFSFFYFLLVKQNITLFDKNIKD